jgi:hypothetical protein
LNVDLAAPPLPRSLSREGRGRFSLSLDGGEASGQREVGERVFAKYSPYLIAEPIEVSKSQPPISTGTSKNLCSKRRSVISVSFLQRLVRSMQTAV